MADRQAWAAMKTSDRHEQYNQQSCSADNNVITYSISCYVGASYLILIRTFMNIILQAGQRGLFTH